MLTSVTENVRQAGQMLKEKVIDEYTGLASGRTAAAAAAAAAARSLWSPTARHGMPAGVHAPVLLMHP
jgi:hypothetical protein